MDLLSIMSDVVKFVEDHMVTITVVTYGLINVVNAITPLTKTTADDSAMKKVVAVVDKIFDAISFLTKKDARGTVKLPVVSTSKPTE